MHLESLEAPLKLLTALMDGLFSVEAVPRRVCEYYAARTYALKLGLCRWGTIAKACASKGIDRWCWLGMGTSKHGMHYLYSSWILLCNLEIKSCNLK